MLLCYLHTTATHTALANQVNGEASELVYRANADVEVDDDAFAK